jgi:hypothetical protein
VASSSLSAKASDRRERAGDCIACPHSFEVYNKSMLPTVVALALLAWPTQGQVSDEFRDGFALYKKLQLPLPLKGSTLIAIRQGEASNGQGKYWTTYRVGFLAPAGAGQQGALVDTHWESAPTKETKHLKLGEPLPDLARFYVPLQVFHKDIHIALAMQLFSLGEEAFAASLVRETEEYAPYSFTVRNASFIGYRVNDSVSSRVVMLAVSHWANRLLERGFDRQKVLAKLREVDKTGLISHKDKWGWGFAHLLKCLEAHETVRFPQVPGESIVEDLLECAGHVSQKEKEPQYRKVLELGLDAVPALLNHWDDPRLTRLWDLEDMALPRRIFQMKEVVRLAIHDISQGSFGPSGNFVWGGKKEDVEAWYRKKVGR